MTRVLLVAGGSGGHLFPAIALSRQLESRAEAECFLLSTRRPVDRLLSEISEESWTTVELERFTPLWRWLLPGHWVRQARGLGQIRAALRRIRPDVVVGFGGYLSAASLSLARAAGIPTVIHEQNLLPGRANRWMARLGTAGAVAVSFPQTKRHLPARARVEVTGNPIRLRPGGVTPAQARAGFGFDPERPVLLVAGGSQGSRAINRLLLEMWEQVPPADRQGVQVLHLTGAADAEEARAAYRRLGMTAQVFPFLHEMERALTAATLAISRAGATGISEMVAFTLPAILIPYPHAGAHQRANAEWMRSVGGAVVLEEARMDSARLWRETSALLRDAERLERMRRNLFAQKDGRAADTLASLVKEVAA